MHREKRKCEPEDDEQRALILKLLLLLGYDTIKAIILVKGTVLPTVKIVIICSLSWRYKPLLSLFRPLKKIVDRIDDELQTTCYQKYKIKWPIHSSVRNRRIFNSHSLLKSLPCSVALESHYNDLNMHIFNMAVA